MNEWNDTDLLSAYVNQQSEAAFEVLVERYIALVYSAARRQVHDRQLAEEVTQAVFILLAQKSRRLNVRTVLSGWLCRVAYYVARNALKAAFRRQSREREAYMQSIADQSETDAWQRFGPMLDEALAHLKEADRNALVLRFYERKALTEVGGILGVDPDTAQKRVSRALEKLRKFFAKRGVASTTAIIAGAISANSVQAAPAGLAQTISAAAVAKGAAASASTLTLVKGALKVMAWTKTKTTTVTAVCLILLLGGSSAVVFKKAHAETRPSDPNKNVTYERSHLDDPQYKSLLANLRGNVWPKERQLAEDEIKGRQQVDETVNAHTISLKSYTNAALTDSPASPKRIKDNNLAELPTGIHDFGGVPFDVEGLIQLDGTNMLTFRKHFPIEVDGIPIGRKCARIHLFHGADWIYAHDFGRTVAKLVLHYADGSTRELEIVAGENVFDSWSPLFTTGVDPRLSQMAPGTERAWTGSNPFIKRIWPDESIVLYKSTFENPQPGVAVSDFDYVSTRTGTAPFLLGLTVE